jgi:hypothetical protein
MQPVLGILEGLQLHVWYLSFGFVEGCLHLNTRKCLEYTGQVQLYSAESAQGPKRQTDARSDILAPFQSRIRGPALTLAN